MLFSYKYKYFVQIFAIINGVHVTSFRRSYKVLFVQTDFSFAIVLSMEFRLNRRNTFKPTAKEEIDFFYFSLSSKIRQFIKTKAIYCNEQQKKNDDKIVLPCKKIDNCVNYVNYTREMQTKSFTVVHAYEWQFLLSVVLFEFHLRLDWNASRTWVGRRFQFAFSFVY